MRYFVLLYRCCSSGSCAAFEEISLVAVADGSIQGSRRLLTYVLHEERIQNTRDQSIMQLAKISPLTTIRSVELTANVVFACTWYVRFYCVGRSGRTYFISSC